MGEGIDAMAIGEGTIGVGVMERELTVEEAGVRVEGGGRKGCC